MKIGCVRDIYRKGYIKGWDVRGEKGNGTVDAFSTSFEVLEASLSEDFQVVI